jgi:bacillithiol system protein YtxJ
MNWIELNDENQLKEIQSNSFERAIVIFKHSTRCSISIMAKGRLDRAIQPIDTDFYYLDLLSHRSISNKIADLFAVPHQSPQVLLIKNAECVYEETHNGIDMDDLKTQL